MNTLEHAKTSLDIAISTYTAAPKDPSAVLAAFLDYADAGAWSERTGTIDIRYVSPGEKDALVYVVVLDLPRRRYAVSASYPGRLLRFSKTSAGQWDLDQTEEPSFADPPDIGVTWGEKLGTMFQTAADKIAERFPEQATFLRQQAARC